MATKGWCLAAFVSVGMVATSTAAQESAPSAPGARAVTPGPLEAAHAPAPAQPRHQTVYAVAGGLGVAGVASKLAAFSLTARVDQHILSPLPPDQEARQAFTALNYAGEGLLLGSLVALGEARYQQTQRPRSLYLGAAALVGYASYQVIQAGAIRVTGQDVDALSGDIRLEANAAAALGAVSSSALVLGQALWTGYRLRHTRARHH